MRIAFVSAAFAVVACSSGAAILAADDAPKQATGAPPIQDAPWFKKADKDGDGKLSRAEFWNAELFSKVDTDQDGFATPAELRDYYAKNSTPRKGQGGPKKDAGVPARPAEAEPTQAAAKPDTANPDDVEKRPVVIWSDGTRMAGDVYLPKNRQPGEKLPGIVLCAGTGGTKKGLPTRLGPILARAGYVCLGFDYRGWGESEARVLPTGPVSAPSASGDVTVTGKPIRWQMNLMDQTFDIRAAISYLQGEPEVDPERIGLFGSSYGGGLVTLMAAIDPRVKCVAAQVGGLGIGPAADKFGFDLLQKQARSETEPVPIETGKLGGKLSSYEQMRRNPARSVGFGEKDEVVGRIRIPMIFVDAENEELLNTKENGEKFASILKANGVPVEYHVIKGISHYGIYGEGFEQATKLELAWFTKYLKGEAAATPAAEPPKTAAQPAKSEVDPTPGAKSLSENRKPLTPGPSPTRLTSPKSASGEGSSPVSDKTQRRLQENFTKLDTDADGKLTRAEHDLIKVHQKYFREHPEEVGPRFTRLDADGNGTLSLDEYLRRKIAEPPSKKEDAQPANATTPPTPPATSQEATTAAVVDIAFFEKNIRPLLISKCYECHSADVKEPKGGLTLDTREGMRLGGESGPAVVPGDVAASLLVSAVRHKDGLEMPPKEKLTEQQIAAVVRWIEKGAPDPRDGVATAPKKRDLTKEPDLTKDRDFAVRSLIENHCITCHGPKVQKAKLRLDDLQPDLRDERNTATWVKVHDKLAAGEMPPKYRQRPAQDELQAATMWLKKELHATSLEHQQKSGRVLIRRLNATEYENTMRDLLGTSLNLKDMLPDDEMVAGFDNIGAALDVSATHQRLYQDLADRAIAAVIPTHPPLPFSDIRTGKEIAKGFVLSKPVLKDDAVILYGKAGRLAYCRSAEVPIKGRYKVQLSIAAVGAENKPVPVAFMDVTERDFAEFRELRDIPPGKPAVVETEIELERSHAFVVDLLTAREPKSGRGVMVEWIKIETQLDPWPPTGYQRLFAGVPLKPRSVAEAEAEGKTPPKIPAQRSESEWAADPLVPASAHPKEDAERLVRDFLPRAFRRPVSDEMLQQYVARVHDRLDNGYPFQEAMTYAYKAILSSPHFLLLLEPGDQPALVKDDFQSTKLDDYALAARLSYFLWSTSPDQELLDLAARRELTRPDVLRSQVERMLASPKSHQFTENFVGHWLDLRTIDDTVPDPRIYADFDPILLWAMPRETYSFFEEVLKNDRSLLEFVDSDWTMLNQRLAKLYGIPGVIGNELRKVTLPPGSHRGGVMTHASVLKVTADGMTTSPVRRGKWVLERMIGKPPAPPPPDVPAIEPDIRGATTVRQQLDKHRTNAVCAQCHVHIDPPGFALENFDPIGGWRDYYRVSAPTSRGTVDLPGFKPQQPVYRGPDVENGGETHDGRKFKNIDDYKQLLLADKDELARNLTQKLLVYSTGADMQFADRELVEQIVAQLATKNYGFRTLLHEIVQSRAFLNK